MTTAPTTPTHNGSRRPRVAALWFGVAFLVAAYWVTQVVGGAGESGFGRSWGLESGYLLVVGGTMALLPALAGLHYLAGTSRSADRWRLPTAGLLSALGLVLVPFYGFGLYALIASVVLVRRERRGGSLSVAGWIIRVAAWVGVVAGAAMTLLAVGLCGPAIIGGVCNA
jgi:hypothetical protein